MASHDGELHSDDDFRQATDKQLKDASVEQIENLVQRINLALQLRGMNGLVWQQSGTRTDRQHPHD